MKLSDKEIAGMTRQQLIDHVRSQEAQGERFEQLIEQSATAMQLVADNLKVTAFADPIEKDLVLNALAAIYERFPGLDRRLS